MSPRERLRAFAHRAPSPRTSLAAAWTARHLWDSWPPRRTPRPLHLIRRPEATADQWAGVRLKLEAAREELAGAGVPVGIEWGEQQATIEIAGERQLELGWAVR